MKPAALLLAPAFMLLSGCMHARHERPAVPLPDGYRGQAATAPASGGTGSSFGELRWEDLVRDPRLNALIAEALANNVDARTALARVAEARANLGAARSQRFPAANGSAGYNNFRISRDGASQVPDGYSAESDYTAFSGGFSWEVDLWGRIRNSSAAARANLLAAVETCHLVRQTLVGEVAREYFLLRDLDQELEITRRSLALREESLELVKLRVDNGYSPEIDQRQADALVIGARAGVVDLERQIEQAENGISVLVGRNPGSIVRGLALTEQILSPALPPGLPSTLLERRPDIRRAERQLIATEAEAAVARAAFFPRIALTASGGFESAALLNLLKLANGTWLFGPALNLPFLHPGERKAGVRAANARREQALLAYQETVRQGFREVADSLAGYRQLSRLMAEQTRLVETLRQAVELSDLRYKGGVASYLEYLDSERQLLDAQLRLAQVNRDALIAVIDLYRALGGGWNASGAGAP